MRYSFDESEFSPEAERLCRAIAKALMPLVGRLDQPDLVVGVKVEPRDWVIVASFPLTDERAHEYSARLSIAIEAAEDHAGGRARPHH